MYPWNCPQRPWSRVHIDHAGPFMNHYFLIIIDAYSKWTEVLQVSSTSSSETINKLRHLFATHGLPSVMVSDNATSFTSEEFGEFLHLNGIKLITSAPYHPVTNGLAEKAVQSFKEAMKKMSGLLPTRISRYLFASRNTPHTTTGIAPSELLMGRKLHTHLDLLRPDLEQKVNTKQSLQKSYHDSSAFSVGDYVYVRNYGVHGAKWLPGSILQKLLSSIILGSTSGWSSCSPPSRSDNKLCTC